MIVLMGAVALPVLVGILLSRTELGQISAG
jgi:hypothetical protein